MAELIIANTNGQNFLNYMSIVYRICPPNNTYKFKIQDSNIIYSVIEGLVQDCSNSIANAMELLQSCIKPLI